MTAQFETLLQHALGADYQLERELEAGGMSRLFIAKDARLNRQVVIKVLPPDLVSTTSVARFKREIELTVRLQHPHILPILTSGEWEDGFYYVTPFIAGESLRDRLARDGKLPLDEALKILRDVSGALAFAHQRGIVHRDIKPGNILLADGHAILADFGIARAVSTTATPLTESGVAPGTPAYMAPELLTDERADVYALGVVAYEMLTGAKPQIPARNVKTELFACRRGLSENNAKLRRIAELLARSLSTLPDRRPPNARAFSIEIESAFAATVRLDWKLAAGLVTLVVGVILAASFSLSRGAVLSDDRYTIVPVDYSDADTTGRALADALAEWRGVTVFITRIPRSSIARSSRVEIAAARNVARSVRARYLVLLATTVVGDSVLVQATLYDALGDSSIRVRRAPFRKSGKESPSLLKSRWRYLANGLVRTRDEMPWRSPEDDATPSLSAWRTYDAGRRALGSWELARAESLFRRSIALDESLDVARLWLAQTIEWTDRVSRRSEIRSDLRATSTLARQLTPKDSIHALALLNLTAGSFLQACAEFQKLRQLDSTSLVAWIGIGDCQALDHSVIPDGRSPTGWSFESSYEEAARAYMRTLELGPSDAGSFQGWVFGRLSGVRAENANQIRLGYARRADSAMFSAFPELGADTIQYEPFPAGELNSGRHAARPSMIEAGVNRNRILMRQVAEEWVRRFPADPAAYDSLSTWAEVSGGSASIDGRQVTTLELVQRALLLTTNANQRTRLRVKRTRLLLKDGQFDAARIEAEGLLKPLLEVDSPYIDGATGLAALVGHGADLARLIARDSSSARVVVEGRPPIVLPHQLAELAARLTAASVLGIENDATSLARRTSETLDSYFREREVAGQVRGSILEEALTLVFPAGSALLLQLPEPKYLGYRVFRTLALGDTAAARAELARLQVRSAGQPAGTAIEMNYRRASLALLIGDTTAAVNELDPVLRALPTLSPLLLNQPAQAATLVRSFELRAEIAARTGDTKLAARYAHAVLALWADADSALRPALYRMSALAK